MRSFTLTATAAAVASIASAWEYRQEVLKRDGTFYGESKFNLWVNLYQSGRIEIDTNMRYYGGGDLGRKSIMYMCFGGGEMCIGSEKTSEAIVNFAQRSQILADW